MQFVTVFVGDEELGLPLERVRQVVEARPVTRVPSMPPAIRGVANVRGKVVPVVDLATALGITGSDGSRSCFMLVEVAFGDEMLLLALHADAIGQVLEPEEVLPPPTFGARVPLRYLAGMAAVDQRFALLLDLDRTLKPEELLAAARLEGGDGG
jgi:purine-binding chemotaxis protein CheW